MHDPVTSDPTQPIYWFCGEPEMLEIGEVWSDSNFVFDTCCESLLDCVASEMHADPAWARDLLRRLGAEALTGQRLRRVCDGEGSTPMLDCKLQVRPIGFRDAAGFVATHHAHCGPPLMHRFSLGVWNGPWLLVGVVIVANPVARALMGRNLVEAVRVCVRRDTEPMLRDGCCSKLYAEAARSAECAGYSKIITYLRADEEGVSVHAAGWTKEADVTARGWHSARRRRSNGNNAFVPKTRWSRTLRPKPKAPAALTRTEPATLPDWAQIGDAEPRTGLSAPFG